MDKYLNDMISSLQWLIRIDSVETEAKEGMPFGEGCFNALRYILSLSQSMGFKVKNVDGYAGHAEVGEGELFGILGHLDTVPHGSDWTYPATGAVIDNGRLYGRGAMDDKGPVIACLYAVKALLDEGLKPKKRIRLIYGCDEESGWKCIEHYFKCEEMPAMGFSPDADFPVINCEKGLCYYRMAAKLPRGVISVKGGLRPNMVPDYASAEVKKAPVINSDAKITKTERGYLIECFGRSVHASTPDGGVNALWKLFDILALNYGGIFKDIQAKLTCFDGGKCNLKLSDKLSGRLTMNLGTAETSDGLLILTIDTRRPVSYTKEYVLDVFSKELPAFSVTQGDFHNHLYVEPGNPLVKSLLKAYNKVTGGDAQPITIGGGTYARALPLAVAFGPLFPGQVPTIHCRDEYIALDDLLKMSKIYYEAIKELCF